MLFRSGATSHTGPTTLNQGTVKLGAAASLASSPLIRINNGATLDVSAVSPTFSIPAAQSLAGSGTLIGNATVAGTLSPAAAAAGPLTITGNLTIGNASRLVIPFEPLGGGALHGSVRVTGTTVISGAATLLVDAPVVDFSSSYWRSPHSFTVLTTTTFDTDYSTSSPISISPASDGAGQGVWSVSFGGTSTTLHWSPATPLAAWRYSHFGTMENNGQAADTEDPDHDGIPNLLEFALGTDPRSAISGEGHAALPAVSFQGTRSVLSFVIPEPAPQGLRYEVQLTDDLSVWKAIAVLDSGGDWTWQGDGPSAITLTPGGGRTHIAVGDETHSPEPARRFFRLRTLYSDPP